MVQVLVRVVHRMLRIRFPPPALYASRPGSELLCSREETPEVVEGHCPGSAQFFVPLQRDFVANERGRLR